VVDLMPDQMVRSWTPVRGACPTAVTCGFAAARHRPGPSVIAPTPQLVRRQSNHSPAGSMGFLDFRRGEGATSRCSYVLLSARDDEIHPMYCCQQVFVMGQAGITPWSG
jgi:hypothetical protein